MKFNTGDKVRVKSWEEIKKTLDDCRAREDLLFAPEMKEFCKKEFIIKQVCSYNRFMVKDNRWIWHADWLEPLPKTEKAVLVRGMSEYDVRRLLGGQPKSIETIEVKRSLKEIITEIYNKPPLFNFHFYGNATIAIDNSGRYIGVARCNPNDTWDTYVGRALSKARAMKWDSLEQELLSTL